MEVTLTSPQLQIPIATLDDFIVTINQPDVKEKPYLVMWVVDVYDQPIGGETDLPFKQKTILKGRKVHIKQPTFAKIVIEVHRDDIKTKLPWKIGVSIRSKSPVNIGYLRTPIEGDEIGYSTPEHMKKAKQCPLCKYPLTVKRTSTITNIGECHNRCIKCHKCNKIIFGNFILKNNIIFFPNC